MPMKKILLILLCLFLLAAISYTSFYLVKIDALGKKITTGRDDSFFNALGLVKRSRDIELSSSPGGRINILLLGIAGQGRAGTNLTDTMMIASVNLKTNQIALLSIPRDLYVDYPQENRQAKINTFYQHGLSLGMDDDESVRNVQKALSDLTGLDMHYYILLNYDGFIKTIDAIGGININNERDIYDPRYPGPNYSYETFELKKGFYKDMDGATALKYARERHNDPEGDFGRAKRQQQILQSAKNKIFSAKTLLNVSAANGLFDSLGGNIKTNIKMDEFDDFLTLLERVDTNNITNVVLDAWNKESLLKVSHVFYENIAAFILIPRVGNNSEIRELAENIFDLNAIKRRRQEIKNEDAAIAIINQSADAGLTNKIKKLLSENLDYKNVIVLDGSSSTVEENSSVYDITSKKKPFTLDELSTRLPARISDGIGREYKKIIENFSPDIVVILGKDLSLRYNMEEDSIEDYKKSEEND